MKVAYVVLTCNKYLDRQQAILSTWGVGQALIFLNDDLTTVEGYGSCPHKYAAFFRTHEPEHDAYVFTDDDTYVNTTALETVLTALPSEPILWGDWRVMRRRELPRMEEGEHELAIPFYFPRGGAGFILNRGAFDQVKNFVMKTPVTPIARGSDVTMGVWIKRSGVRTINDSRFSPEFLDDAVDRLRAGEQFTCHYVTPEKMRALHAAVTAP